MDTTISAKHYLKAIILFLDILTFINLQIKTNEPFLGNFCITLFVLIDFDRKKKKESSVKLTRVKFLLK